MRLEGAPAARHRVPGIDIARGIALAAMIVFHGAWDLSFLGLIEADIRDIPAWTWFAHAIAASFLMLAGMSLVLAHEAGLDRAAFLRRLGIVAGAALLVTGVTYFVFPRSFVFFGILHAIALGSVLALPFVRIPAWATAALAAFILVLPGLARFESFSSPWLVWLGLGTRMPVTNDFVPVFPWFAFVLFGIALAKTLRLARLSGPAPATWLARLLERAGRNSLIVYLVHQPLLFGSFWLLALALIPQPAPEARGFLSACYSQCATAGGDRALCTRLCTCAVDGLKSEGLWAGAITDKLNAAGKERADAIGRRCAETAAAGQAPQ